MRHSWQGIDARSPDASEQPHLLPSFVLCTPENGQVCGMALRRFHHKRVIPGHAFGALTTALPACMADLVRFAALHTSSARCTLSSSSFWRFSTNT